MSTNQSNLEKMKKDFEIYKTSYRSYWNPDLSELDYPFLNIINRVEINGKFWCLIQWKKEKEKETSKTPQPDKPNGPSTNESSETSAPNGVVEEEEKNDEVYFWTTQALYFEKVCFF